MFLAVSSSRLPLYLSHHDKLANPFQMTDVNDGDISETDRLSFLDFPAPSSSLYMSLPSGYDIADFFGDPFA
jgi:hypothetical protein